MKRKRGGYIGKKNPTSQTTTIYFRMIWHHAELSQVTSDKSLSKTFKVKLRFVINI